MNILLYVLLPELLLIGLGYVWYRLSRKRS